MLSMTATVDAPARTEVEAFQAAMDDFIRAQRRVRGRFNRVPAVPELSRSQYQLLETLESKQGARSVGELADEAGVTPPTATRMLDGLQDRGIVERTTRDGDRRVVLITLTQHGRDLVAAKRAHSNHVRELIYSRLTPAERKAAPGLLHSLAAAIEELEP